MYSFGRCYCLKQVTKLPRQNPTQAQSCYKSVKLEKIAIYVQRSNEKGKAKRKQQTLDVQNLL